jgi:hypothetical protein
MDYILAMVIFILGLFLLAITPFVPSAIGRFGVGFLGIAALIVGSFGTFIGVLV